MWQWLQKLNNLFAKVQLMALDLTKLETDVAALQAKVTALQTAAAAAATTLGGLTADLNKLQQQIANLPSDPVIQSKLDAIDATIGNIGSTIDTVNGNLSAAVTANPA